MDNVFLNLTNYGDQILINRSIDSERYVKWVDENFEYVRYNPRKDIRRYGLSLTSLDGGMTGIPDLDSLLEYNFENGTNYSDRDFVTHTPAFNYEGLQKLIEPWIDDIFRSHILRLDPGGYFPPHRDERSMHIDALRLIVPLKNCNAPMFNFVLEDKILNWQQGKLYFLNTCKMHYLFNASFLPSYWIVFNVLCNEKTVTSILENLVHT